MNSRRMWSRRTSSVPVWCWNPTLPARQRCIWMRKTARFYRRFITACSRKRHTLLLFLGTERVGIISKETDRAFHYAIAKASGSGLYPKIMELVLGAMEQQLWEMILSRTIATKKYQDQNNREHLRVCEAILAGRADEAHAGMKAHMEMLYERYWSE